jgi:flagellar hook-associated protein 2
MAITAAGVGSGLDVENIVSQLMALERRPLNAMQQRESEFRADLSAFGRLKSAINNFKGAMEELGTLEKFQVFAADSSDEDTLTVSADSSAAQGVFSIHVERLAQNHKLASAQVDDAANTLIGGNVGDKLELQIGDGSSGTLSINLEAGKTLEQLRTAINEDESNPGITASVLNVGDGSQRLILTSRESGYDSRIVATETFDAASTGLGLAEANKKPDGNPLDSLTDLDAAFSVDGFDVTASSNNVTSVIDGISLELKQTGDADININRDVDAIKESMQGFVDAYNEVQGLIASLGAGELSGDSTLRSLQGQLRGVLNTGPESISSVFSSLGELGVATQRDGTLSFDSSDFESALNSDFSGVAQLLANDDQGFAFRFAALAESILADDGLIDSREDGINSQIRTLENRQLSLEDRLELKEKAMRSQFAALDSLLGQMQSTSQFLVNQLGLL